MATTLWCIEVRGPEDVHAMPSLTAARREAHKINTALIERGRDDEFEPNVWASPAVWPWSAEEHANDMARDKINR